MKKRAEAGDAIAGYTDSEARIVEGQSRGEFATRRGGRRRRRGAGKNRPQGTPATEPENGHTDGQDDDVEQVQFVEPEEEIVVAPPPQASSVHAGISVAAINVAAISAGIADSHDASDINQRLRIC